ncbi:MAG: NUDIX hydrolase [Clostridium sp.]
MKEKIMSQSSDETPSHMVTPVRRVNREFRYQGAILKVYQDTVEVNGHQAKWDFIHHNGAAAVVAVTKEGKLLMVRQYRNALDRYTLEIPAGALDYPEEPKIDCAYRELEEETGFKTEHLEYLLSINTTIAFCDEAIDVFLARDLILSKQHLDPDENIEVEEWELKDLLNLIYTGKMTDGKTISSILAYAQKFGK